MSFWLLCCYALKCFRCRVVFPCAFLFAKVHLPPELNPRPTPTIASQISASDGPGLPSRLLPLHPWCGWSRTRFSRLLHFPLGLLLLSVEPAADEEALQRYPSLLLPCSCPLPPPGIGLSRARIAKKKGRKSKKDFFYVDVDLPLTVKPSTWVRHATPPPLSFSLPSFCLSPSPPLTCAALVFHKFFTLFKPKTRRNSFDYVMSSQVPQSSSPLSSLSAHCLVIYALTGGSTKPDVTWPQQSALS